MLKKTAIKLAFGGLLVSLAGLAISPGIAVADPPARRPLPPTGNCDLENVTP